MNTTRLVFLAAALIVSGSAYSSEEDLKALESNLSNIIYCKEYVMVDEAIKPSLNETKAQLCEKAYTNFKAAVDENLSDSTQTEMEKGARVLVAASYMTQGEDRYYMKDFSSFPLELKASELPRCLRICQHFASLQR